jgi:hypothetical protein
MGACMGTVRGMGIRRGVGLVWAYTGTGIGSDIGAGRGAWGQTRAWSIGVSRERIFLNK